MATYTVCYPMSAMLILTVEADNEEEAIEKGLEAEWQLKPAGCNVEEVEIHRDVSRGNVNWFPIGRAEATED